jgi:hypothetical protein
MNDTRRLMFMVLMVLMVLALASASLGGCLPSFEDRPWLVDDTRILAIRSIPAEARPSEIVSYEALIVGPGELDGASVTWAFCLQPRTAEERGAVTRDCLRGRALSITSTPAALPSDACARFGPTPLPTQGNEPARRPTDPDASGGYAIPVRALASVVNLDGEEVAAFGKTRLRCDLAGATRPVFDEYQDRYTLNQNPEIDVIEALGPDGPVASGASVQLRLRTADNAVESYVRYRLELGTLIDVRESLSVRWYVTGGDLERAAETATIAEQGRALEFRTTWIAPADPGQVHGWVVLTDDRGGTTWASFEIEIE